MGLLYGRPGGLAATNGGSRPGQSLDLSKNAIAELGDLSTLRRLKVLDLSANLIKHLRPTPRVLPRGLDTLRLANNVRARRRRLSALAFPYF